MVNSRLPALDLFRGLAVGLMIIYHFCYDLNHFAYIDIDMQNSFAWRSFRYFIMALFLFSVGVSLSLANQNGIVFSKVWHRLAQLGLASSIVSIGSWTQFQETWIYFGILHFILVSSLLGLIFLNYPKLSLGLSVLLFLGSLGDILHTNWLFSQLQPVINLPNTTEDLVPFFPWFSVVLLGIGLTKLGLTQVFLKHHFWQNTWLPKTPFSFFGRHSLLVYLLHQPILFGLFFLPLIY